MPVFHTLNVLDNYNGTGQSVGRNLVWSIPITYGTTSSVIDVQATWRIAPGGLHASRN
ncbi:hypothetical protein GO730_26775 [Spirosoma sp. HMF3257]|uniref:hypothetical protein n=1 Tax=Spirosoma telluris TaxID=2183553 RepID=UPI0012F85A3E|nr:hypothetical protein [Spirosoma telluris]